jgi:hypothetical protein
VRQRHVRVPCGFARVSNVETGALSDEMDSFMLSETAKCGRRLPHVARIRLSVCAVRAHACSVYGR